MQRLKLVPRVARDVASRDQSITLFGRRQPMPLIIAPTGIADLMLSRRARGGFGGGGAGIAFSQATSSTTLLAEIAQIVPEGRWCQLYLWENRAQSLDLIDRAAEQGFETLVLTVDLPIWCRCASTTSATAWPIRSGPTHARVGLCAPSALAHGDDGPPC
ncbi:MAG: alpha-hydroxy-acid oxidizing protein [Sphingomonadaceae bacterium]